MLIEYGRIKGIEGLLFVVKDGRKIKAIYPFLCKRMDLDFCLEYVVSKWGKPDSVKKADLSYLSKTGFDELDLSFMSSFSKKVYRELYLTKPGTIFSYGELAAKVGKPRAARVIGTLMRKNPFPILVPCHRVCSRSGAEHYSITCFYKRPTTCIGKKEEDLRECSKRIKSSLREQELE